MKRKYLAIAAVLLMMIGAAFAAQTVLTATALKENNYNVQAGDLAVVFSACDATNGNAFVTTGREILIVQNPDASAHTFTVTSVPDGLGRSDTSLTAYSVPATSSAGIYLVSQIGWKQTNGQMFLACNSNLLKFAIIQPQH
jgi:uncharacterized protein YjdB